MVQASALSFSAYRETPSDLSVHSLVLLYFSCLPYIASSTKETKRVLYFRSLRAIPLGCKPLCWGDRLWSCLCWEPATSSRSILPADVQFWFLCSNQSELLYAKDLMDKLLAYQKQRPVKLRPKVQCYSGTLGMAPFAFHMQIPCVVPQQQLGNRAIAGLIQYSVLYPWREWNNFLDNTCHLLVVPA